MKKLLIALFCLAPLTAHAQTMVTKTPPAAVAVTPAQSGCSPTLCTGLYAGGTIGVGIIAADFGAQYYNGSTFIGGEVGGGAQVYTDTSYTNSENGLFAWQIAKIGGTLSGLLGNTATPEGLPTGITAQVIAPYALAGAVEHQIAGVVQTGWATGGGIEYDVSKRIFADVKYLFAEYDSSSKVPNESIVLASINYKF